LAHNAPLVDGKSQPLRDGALIAYDEREGFGWIVAEFRIPEGDVRLERTVVVAPDYLIDELRWTAERDVRVELPWHVDATASELAAGTHFRLQASAQKHAGLLLHLTSDRPTELYSAQGPGQPSTTQRSFYVLRTQAREGLFRALISWTGEVRPSDARHADGLEVHSDGVRQKHRRDAKGWHIELFAGSAHSGIDLGGFCPPPDAQQQSIAAPRPPTVLRRAHVPSGWLSEWSAATRTSLIIYELGEAHYRRSEDPWKAAGAPHATIGLAADAGHLVVFATIVAGERHFAVPDATNPLDNESADTMGAGVQLYVRAPEGTGAWMLIPEVDRDRVRVRAIDESPAFGQPAARWRPHKDGYELRIELPLPAVGENNEYPIDVDVIVNETTAQRQRRRGQLVMSGARGEFVYLRGDRHDLARLIPLVLVS
jgi:hypothetical protein